MITKLFAGPVAPTEISKSAAFRLLTYLIDGNEPAKADPHLIESVFCEVNDYHVYRFGQVQLHNFMFDFKPFLNQDLVKTKDRGYETVYAISVDWVFKASNEADNIIEVKKITH